MIDLTIPEHAYMYGFFLCDGHLYKQKNRKDKGKFSLEISSKDADIIYKFGDIIKNENINYTIRERTRKTNFCKKYIKTK